MKRVLFVCSQNRLRSPTAEQVFSAEAGIEVSSAGIHKSASNPVTAELPDWADIVFVMEKAHRNKLGKQFRASLNGKRVICLDIPGEYAYMQPSLVNLLRAKVSPFLPRVQS